MSEAGQFEPIYPRHAIERCAWSLSFAQQLPEKLYLRSTIEARELLAAHGISSIPVQSVNFDTITGAVSIGAAYGPQEFGTPDGSLVLSLMPDGIVWQTTRYTRWDAFWEQVNEIVLQIARPFTEALPVSSVKLEYWDRFIWSGSWSDMRLEELLTKSDRIAWGAVRPSAPWHSHCGWFEENGHDPRRLVNTNLNALDFRANASSLPKPSVGIYTMVQDFFIFPPFIHHDADEQAVLSQTQKAHEYLKSLLADLIVPEVQKRISLNTRGAPHDV